MQAGRYYGQGDVRIDDINRRQPGVDEVLIEVDTCGICGTDIHEYRSGPNFIPETAHPLTGAAPPLPLGHEISGTVSDVGDDVDSVEPGDRVCVNPAISCRNCQYCTEGAYNRCVDVANVGLSADQGGFAEYCTVPALNVHELPPGVSLETGALVEPLAVGFHAVRRAGVGVTDTVGVFGAGSIGLASVIAARAAGAREVFVSEPIGTRRRMAMEAGAHRVFDPTETNVAGAVSDETDGGVDVAIEAAGTEASLRSSVSATRSGGTTTVVNIFDGSVPMDLRDIVLSEKTVNGVIGYESGPASSSGEFATVIDLLVSGRIFPEFMITKRIPLDHLLSDGFETLADDAEEHVKILVKP